MLELTSITANLGPGAGAIFYTILFFAVVIVILLSLIMILELNDIVHSHIKLKELEKMELNGNRDSNMPRVRTRGSSAQLSL